VEEDNVLAAQLGRAQQNANEEFGGNNKPWSESKSRVSGIDGFGSLLTPQ
jgi:hypothetical protein